jgi:hypothetical protein
MDNSRLARFRTAVVGCFRKARGALSDLCDALATDVTAQSLPELSESPFFRRRWPSIYKALRRGCIDRSALWQVFAAAAPRPLAGERLVLALDVSPMVRRQARTSADRTFVHVPNLPAGAAPVLPGYQFSALVVVPEPVSSAVHVLDNQRIPSTETAASVGAAQLRAVLPLLQSERPILLGDGGYGNVTWLAATADLPVDHLLRIARNSVFYRAAPPPTGKRGRPRQHGAVFKCKQTDTHGAPDDTWTGTDDRGLQVRVAVWGNLHFRARRETTLTVVRRVAVDPAKPAEPPQTLWCIWAGGPLPPLAHLALLYLRRFAIEHGFRFDKQDLHWTSTRLRTPEQAQRWTDIVSIVHNLLGIARSEVSGRWRPWEPRGRPATLRQVRRALGRIYADLGSPVPAPQPRGYSPGRVPGTHPPRAPRYPVIRKSSKRPKKRQAAA